MEHVVEEAVLLVPEGLSLLTAALGHGLGDVQEVLPELAGHVFVGRVAIGQLQRNRHHVEAVHRHPAGAVGLLEPPPGGQLRAAVEHADVVEPEEPALEDVAAVGVLAVDPPREVERQLLEHALEEHAIADAAAPLLDLVDAPRRPGVHRRIDIAEVPLICGHLAVGVHVPLAQHQHELGFGELRIDQRQRHTVERQIPRRVPRVLPLVGHRDHVGRVQVGPLAIA